MSTLFSIKPWSWGALVLAGLFGLLSGCAAEPEPLAKPPPPGPQGVEVSPTPSTACTTLDRLTQAIDGLGGSTNRLAAATETLTHAVNNISVSTPQQPVAPTNSSPEIGLADRRRLFITQTTDMLQAQHLYVKAIAVKSTGERFIYSGGNLNLELDVTADKYGRAEQVRDYVLEWVRECNRRGQVVQQIEYPADLLLYSAGKLSLPELPK